MDDADLIKTRGAVEELADPIHICPIPGADEGEISHRHEVSALEGSGLLHHPGYGDAEDLPEESGYLSLPGPLRFCQPGDDQTTAGHRLLVAHEVEVCERALSHDSDIHPGPGASPVHLDDRTYEEEGKEMLRIQSIGVLFHIPAGLCNLPLTTPDGDSLLRPVDKSLADHRIMVSGIEDGLLEPQHLDPKLLTKDVFEVLMLPARIAAAERPLVEDRVGVQKPEEHLDPGTMDDDAPEPIPLRPNPCFHLIHRPCRRAGAAAVAGIRPICPSLVELLPGKTASASRL